MGNPIYDGLTALADRLEILPSLESYAAAISPASVDNLASNPPRVEFRLGALNLFRDYRYLPWFEEWVRSQLDEMDVSYPDIESYEIAYQAVSYMCSCMDDAMRDGDQEAWGELTTKLVYIYNNLSCLIRIIRRAATVVNYQVHIGEMNLITGRKVKK